MKNGLVKNKIFEALVKASFNRAVKSFFIDPNPGDLTMTRKKLR